jgi:hypothetical protein
VIPVIDYPRPRPMPRKPANAPACCALVVTSLAAAVTLVAPPARAQEPDVGGHALRSVTMSAAQLEIIVPVVINATSNEIAKPISIPLDVYYGVSDRLTLGLTHSGGSIQGVEPYDLDLGLCVTGQDGCERTYDNVGFDALFRLVSGLVQVAAHGGVELRSIADGALGVRAGVLIKAPLGLDLAILIDPRIIIGLTGLAPGERRHGLTLPFAVQYLTDAGIRLAAMSGIEITSVAESYTGYVGGLAAVSVNEKIEAFASFTFNNLFGQNADFKRRALVLGFNIRP